LDGPAVEVAFAATKTVTVCWTLADEAALTVAPPKEDEVETEATTEDDEGTAVASRLIEVEDVATEDEGVALDTESDEGVASPKGLVEVLRPLPLEFMSGPQMIGQEPMSTFKLEGTQLHMRKVDPLRMGRLLLVVSASWTIRERREAASALMVNALI